MKLSVLYKSHRARLLANLRARQLPLKNSIAIFKGSYRFHHYDASTTYTPKYDQNFVYLFGVEEFGFDAFIELATGRSVLVKGTEKMDGMLNGDKKLIESSEYKQMVDQSHKESELSEEQAKELYGIDKIMTRAEFIEHLKNAKHDRLYVNHGIDRYTGIPSNSYDDPEVLALFDDKIDKDSLYPILNNTRTIKSASEAEWMRKIGMISSNAHVDVMRNCKPGMREYQIAAIFYVFLPEFMD